MRTSEIEGRKVNGKSLNEKKRKEQLGRTNSVLGLEMVEGGR